MPMLMDSPTSMPSDQGNVPVSPRASNSPLHSSSARASISLELPARLGRYTLIRVLGVGGMGTVYLAEDTALRRQVALKIPHRAIDAESVEKLLTEARAAAVISHPNVCSLYDVGRVEDQAFLTMEYVAGNSLDQYVSHDKPLNAKAAATLALRIISALQAAHQRGVIHRDLKPANVLMRGPLDPVITDFGLAVRSDQPTGVNKLAGSPAYMAPEQVLCDQDATGAATDVYGLGAILYELLTGRPPFQGPVPSVLYQVLKSRPEAPSRLVAGSDPRLDAICMRALSKSPEDRMTLNGFRNALVDFLRRPRSQAPLDTRPVRLQKTSARSLAEKMYQLDGRQVHRDARQSKTIDKGIQKVRRWRWTMRKQRVGFLAGLAASFLMTAVTATLIWNAAPIVLP